MPAEPTAESLCVCHKGEKELCVRCNKQQLKQWLRKNTALRVFYPSPPARPPTGTTPPKFVYIRTCVLHTFLLSLEIKTKCFFLL